MDPLFVFSSQPGVRRDGTDLDAPYYGNPVWVRWQRGQPRKMGGYRAMTTVANGPVRSVLQDTRSGINSTHLFSQWGIQRVQFAADGSSGTIADRTPLGFTADATLNWSHASMYSSTGGTYSAVIACATPDVLDIASDTAGYIYAGDISTNDPLAVVTNAGVPVKVSGGVCVLQPFLFTYGSNGLISNSVANDYSSATGWVHGGGSMAVANNVAGTKIVYGAPLRGGGQSPAGLFWAIDSLIRVSFVGGTGLWAYDTLATPTTILSKKAVVEHEGKFFWPGTDRFLYYNGVVQELPNQMNCNWFFDNLNYSMQNKVWGTKIARWGEIWWFYPRGTNTECEDAVIFNYRENTWYDAHLQRTAGAPTSVFSFPIWAGHEDATDTKLLTTGVNLQTSAATIAPSNVITFTATTGVVDGMVVSGTGIATGSTVSSHTGVTATLSLATTGVASGALITFTSMAHAFTVGNTVTGGTSGATGIASRVLATSINVSSVTGTFVSGETITGIASATAVIQSTPVSQQLVTQYQQEYGKDKIVGSIMTAIPSSFTSRNFGFAVGAPIEDAPKTVDTLTRIVRLEPDFNQVGDLQLEVIGRSFAQDSDIVLKSYTLAEGQSFQDMGDQARIMKLRISSNSLGGSYEQGQVQVKIEPGDERSTV